MKAHTAVPTFLMHTCDITSYKGSETLRVLCSHMAVQ